MRILKTYIYSNLHIALAALCFLWGNAVLLKLPLDIKLSAYVFASTFFSYQLSRFSLYKSRVFHSVEGDELYDFTDKNLKFTLFSMLLAGVISLGLFCVMPLKVKVLSLAMGGLSVLYPLKFQFGKKSFRLRDLPFLKIFIIALVWSVVGVGFNYAFWNVSPDIKYLITQFLFIIIITLPFDIRDRETDMQTHVSTIPTVFGSRNTGILVLTGTVFYLVFFNLKFPETTLMFKTLYGLMMVWLAILTLGWVEEMKKWKVMLIFDGSMVVFYILTLYS